MEIKMLVDDTEVIPRIKLDQFEFDILKMNKKKLRSSSMTLHSSASICT